MENDVASRFSLGHAIEKEPAGVAPSGISMDAPVLLNYTRHGLEVIHIGGRNANVADALISDTINMNSVEPRKTAQIQTSTVSTSTPETQRMLEVPVTDVNHSRTCRPVRVDENNSTAFAMLQDLNTLGRDDTASCGEASHTSTRKHHSRVSDVEQHVSVGFIEVPVVDHVEVDSNIKFPHGSGAGDDPSATSSAMMPQNQNGRDCGGDNNLAVELGDDVREQRRLQARAQWLERRASKIRDRREEARDTDQQGIEHRRAIKTNLQH